MAHKCILFYTAQASVRLYDSLVRRFWSVQAPKSFLDLQFTDLNKRDQLAKLSEARASSIDQPLKKFKFVSSMNEQAKIPSTLQIQDHLFKSKPPFSLELRCCCQFKQILQSRFSFQKLLEEMLPATGLLLS